MAQTYQQMNERRFLSTVYAEQFPRPRQAPAAPAAPAALGAPGASSAGPVTAGRAPGRLWPPRGPSNPHLDPHAALLGSPAPSCLLEFLLSQQPWEE